MKNIWCEVYLNLIDENIRRVRQNTGKKLIAVVKGDAYGLGIEKVSEYLSDKVDSFAVTYLDEALKVKSSRDILIMTPDYKGEDFSNIRDNFILTIDETENIDFLSKLNRNFRVNIYVNTGMNRFGIAPENLSKLIDYAEKSTGNVKVEGIYTHLQNTNNKKSTINQINVFKECVKPYCNGRYNIHLLNSNGFINYDKYCSFDDSIRVGGLLYGFDGVENGYNKVYRFKASPINTFTIQKGKKVGYGNFYKARKDIRAGVLDFGYIDKFYCPETIFDNKLLSIMGRIYYKCQYKKSISFKNKPIKIIGSVNMNYTLIDMGNLPDDTIFDIEISSMAADSSIPRKYII